MSKILTERLHLRPWIPDDRALYAAMNDDPAVMTYETGRLTRVESDARADEIDRIRSEFGGLGMYASDLRSTGETIGFTVVLAVTDDLPCWPATQIGWRLVPSMWGNGYATEAARALARQAFADLGLAEIVAFSVASNRRSVAVMHRLGMVRLSAEDFVHPEFAASDPRRHHVLYQLSAS
jgi:ribosomal-protein-alanine N-acetyltransferase